MKEIWIAVMAFSYGGCLGFLQSGIYRYDKIGYDFWTVLLLLGSPASIALGIVALKRASKIGQRQDQEKERIRQEKEQEKPLTVTK